MLRYRLVGIDLHCPTTHRQPLKKQILSQSRSKMVCSNSIHVEPLILTPDIANSSHFCDLHPTLCSDDVTRHEPHTSLGCRPAKAILASYFVLPVWSGSVCHHSEGTLAWFQVLRHNRTCSN